MYVCKELRSAEQSRFSFIATQFLVCWLCGFSLLRCTVRAPLNFFQLTEASLLSDQRSGVSRCSISWKRVCQSSHRCDVFNYPLAHSLLRALSHPFRAFRVPPRLVFDLETSKRGSKIRLGDSSIRLWLLSEKHNSALCRCDPSVAPPPAVNDRSWRRLTGPSSGAATAEERHEPVSKEHAVILDIKHLAADPARVTQWAKEKSLHHK